MTESTAPEQGTESSNAQSTGLSGLKLAQLQALAAQLGITGARRMRKSLLVEAIEAHQRGGAVAARDKAVEEKIEQTARKASQRHTSSGDDAAPAHRLAGIRTLFQRRYVAATLLFAGASFCGLLLVYGLNTWLPNIMRTAGYALGSSLLFLLALNTGGIVGTIAASRLADRVGIKPVAIGAFLVAALSVLLLSVDLGLAALVLLVAVAGFGTGAQILVNGFVAVHYPAHSRATALGWSLGIGRIGAVLGPILGGLVAGSGVGYQWNFYLFALFGLVGAVLLVGVPAAVRAAAGPAGTPTAAPAERGTPSG